MDFFRKYRKWLIISGIVLVAGAMLAFVLIFMISHSISFFIEGRSLTVNSNSNIPKIFLTQAGITVTPEDRLLVNGEQASLDKPIENLSSATIQYIPAKRIRVTMDGQTTDIRSSAASLGRALWENNIILSAADYLSLSMDLPMTDEMQVEIRHSQPVRILVQGKEISVSVSAQMVGQALAQAGVALQNLDYSQPAENEPMPADRTIKVVRVHEEIQTQSQAVPYSNELVADAQLEIDNQKVLQAGINGIKLSRMRIRYEDGREVNRQVESEWVAQPPVPQKIAYGTKITIKSVTTADGVMQYWRAVSVYITSYRDTGQTTASGKWPELGDVAVNPTWYKYMKGMQVYIPGYGLGRITDVCPGCVGKPWIDVFFPRASYTGWHRTEVIYFIAPAPSSANILWILP